MISNSTQAVLEEPRSIQGIQDIRPNFPDICFPVPAPWLYATLSQLWDLQHEGTLVRGAGDFRIEAETADRVRKMLSKIGAIRTDLPVPIVNVFSGGGVTLTWYMGPREVKYSFWPEGVLTIWKEEEGQEPIAAELPSDFEFDPREPIQWLLR